MNFDDAFQRLLGAEGGYVSHPDDPGGETRYGITKRVAQANGYQGDMRDFPVSEAKRIARAQYWDAVQADRLPAAVRFDVFDAAYNSGPAQAIKWLQRSLGVKDDGKLGPVTLAAAQQADGYKLLCRFCGHRLDMLNDLPNWGSFGRGWTQRVADNLMKA